MWLKAMLWRLLAAVLLLTLAILAMPAILGWPEGLELDEEVDTSSLEWLEQLESVAVVCKFPSVLSSVRIMLSPVTGSYPPSHS